MSTLNRSEGEVLEVLVAAGREFGPEAWFTPDAVEALVGRAVPASLGMLTSYGLLERGLQGKTAAYRPTAHGERAAASLARERLRSRAVVPRKINGSA